MGFRPTSEGEFRLSILPDGTTLVTARSGNAEIFGPRGSEPITAGKTVLVRGNPTTLSFRIHTSRSRSVRRLERAARQRLIAFAQLSICEPRYPGRRRPGRVRPVGTLPIRSGVGTSIRGRRAGRLTALASGPGRITTAGPGWIPRLGDGRRITMAAGFRTAAMDGVGGRVRFGLRISGVRRWLASSAGVVLESDSGLAVSAGWLWRLSKSFHRWWGPGWYGRGWGGYGGGAYGFRGYGNFARGGDIAHMYRNAAYRNASNDGFVWEVWRSAAAIQRGDKGPIDQCQRISRGTNTDHSHSCELSVFKS